MGYGVWGMRYDTWHMGDGGWNMKIREVLATPVQLVKALRLPLGFHWVSIGFSSGFAAAGAAAATSAASAAAAAAAGDAANAAAAAAATDDMRYGMWDTGC